MNKPLDLKTAARQITAACKAKRERSPFFFITGAGLSTPSVPLAAQIMQECKARAVELYGVTAPPPASDALTAYSHWLEHAYPNAEERRSYLQSMIEGRAVTTANLRLAHLLLNRSPSNLVITTNFDDLLSRGLLLFGKQHVLCDHPSTIGRIQPEREQDIQIVHVHGSYWFYDCCNLKDEIAARAQRSPNVPFDMSAFLDHVLHNRSPLVLGYSGWEGDVVMSALKRRLYHREQPNALGYNVYWFVYDRNHIAALPDWLRNHANVTFVAKPERDFEREPFTSALLNRFVEANEAATNPGAPYTMAALPPEYVAREMKGIVAFEVAVTRIEAKFKLSQNRDEKNFREVIARLRASGEANAAQVAEEMAKLEPQWFGRSAE